MPSGDGCHAFMSPSVDTEPTTAPPPAPASSVAVRVVGPASQRILNGPLALEMARFGVPLALGMGLQTSFNLVDAYIISGLGGHTASAALGAIGVADLIGALGTILSYGLSIATSAIISRKQGEGDKECSAVAPSPSRACWRARSRATASTAAARAARAAGSRVRVGRPRGARGSRRNTVSLVLVSPSTESWSHVVGGR